MWPAVKIFTKHLSFRKFSITLLFWVECLSHRRTYIVIYLYYNSFSYQFAGSLINMFPLINAYSGSSCVKACEPSASCPLRSLISCVFYMWTGDGYSNLNYCWMLMIRWFLQSTFTRRFNHMSPISCDIGSFLSF